MKLYEIEITVTAVVLANDSTHAYSVARGEASEIFRDDPRDDIFVGREIKHADQLPAGWDGDCHAYGGKLGESNRISDYLEDRPEVVERDTKTIDMFAATPSSANQGAGK